MEKQKKIRKNDLIKIVANELNLPNYVVKNVLNCLLKYVKYYLIIDSVIDLANFGIFKKIVRKKRYGYNPFNQEKIIIPESKTVSFNIALNFKKELNERDE